MIVIFISFAVLLGTAVSQEQITLPPDFTLPPELAGKLDLNQLVGIANNQSMPAIKKKCDENGGPQAFENAQKAFTEFTECIQSLVDVKKLQEEIEEAKPNGQVDEVFKKYCSKTPSFKKCFKNMGEAIKPCFDAKEKNNFKTIYNVTEQLAEFICYKDGDRIALFIAEGGQECFQEKQSELQDCMNNTLGADHQLDGEFSPDSFNLPDLYFGEKECGQLTNLQVCVVKSLESCAAPTTGNIVESLFKFVRKATPCSDVGLKKAESKKVPGSASGLAISSLTVLLAIGTIFA